MMYVIRLNNKHGSYLVQANGLQRGLQPLILTGDPYKAKRFERTSEASAFAVLEGNLRHGEFRIIEIAGNLYDFAIDKQRNLLILL